ncbi:hypothetical protein CQ042_11540 [Microbacterium sp. MYb62]|nr:hypothetical protein CQ042_11540 [Microbacterium sp. MYb62]
MRLIELLDAAGASRSMWVNVDHVISVTPMHRDAPPMVIAEAEVRLDGAPSLRVALGEHTSARDAEEAFRSFLEYLQQHGGVTSPASPQFTLRGRSSGPISVPHR